MNERLKRDYETFENGRKWGRKEVLEGAIPVTVYQSYEAEDPCETFWVVEGEGIKTGSYWMLPRPQVGDE